MLRSLIFLYVILSTDLRTEYFFFYILEYYVEWNGIKARVIRPDVECVNGVVHVIDKVLMMNSDVTVSGSAVPAVTGLATLIATFVTVAFARALHH